MNADTIAKLKEAAPTSPAARKRLRNAGIQFSVVWEMNPDYIPCPPIRKTYGRKLAKVAGRKKYVKASSKHGHSRTKALKTLGLVGQRHIITDVELAQLVKIANKKKG